MQDRHAAAKIPEVQPSVTNERGHSKRLVKISDEERAALREALAQAQQALQDEPLPGSNTK